MQNIFSQEELRDLVDRAVDTSKDYIAAERWSEAENLLDTALRVDPNNATAMRMLSNLLANRRKGDEAVVWYEKILKNHPTEFEPLNNVALCYSSMGQIDKSIEKLDLCLTHHPDEPSVYWNLAIQHKEKGDYETAFKVFDRGLTRLPDNADLYYHYGVALGEAGRHADAIKKYETAVELRPGFAAARFNLGLVQLLTGGDGWDNYESRFEREPVFGRFKKRFKGPEWTGEEGTGTVLVYNEQGVGDAVQFARYIPAVKAKVFKVVAEVVPELVELMGQSGADGVVPQRYKKTPPYDYHVSLGSLPRLLGGVAWAGPYLEPTGSAKGVFDTYAGKFKIGVAWAGNPVHRDDKTRSAFLKDFLPLANIPGAKLFSLMKDPRQRFWAGRGVVDLTAGCDGMGVVDLSDILVDFNHTAAVMKELDAIVTVDTAIAHLAGAMGLPAHVLLPHSPDWRWGLTGNRTPWYPSLKLVRQTKPGDFATRVKQVAYDLRQNLG